MDNAVERLGSAGQGDRTTRRSHSEGDWVRIGVTATVVNALKNTPSNRLRPGAAITFAEEGGEISLGKRTIRGLVPWSRPLEAGTTHLLFGGVSESDELLVGTTYELRNNRFAGITGDTLNDLDALGGDSVLEEIKSKSTLPLPWQQF